MKKFSKLGLAALSIAFFISLFAVSETSAQVNEILKRMELHANALQSIKGGITRSLHDILLDEHDVQSGDLYYKRGKGRKIALRIDFLKPVKETLAVSNGKYLLYQPRLKQAHYGNASKSNKSAKAGGNLEFMTMSRKQIKSNYKVRQIGVETIGAVKMWHLELTPKTKADYKTADLWVDNNGMPVQTKIIRKNGDSTTIRLTKFKKNVNIPNSVFKVDLPKGVKLIKD